MRFIKSIINTNNNIIGFTMEGTGKEFGNDKVIGILYKNILIEELIRVKFSNDQISFAKGKMECKDNFQINGLNMMKLTDEGQLVDVDNSVRVVGIEKHGGDIIGFHVELAGDSKKYTVADTLRLCEWFKPDNFVVVGQGDERAIKLAGIPLIRKAEINKKAKERTALKRIQQSNSEGADCVDFITLMNIVKRHNGLIVRAETDPYKSTTNSSLWIDEQFIDDGVGEVAAPVLGLTEWEFNATLNFRKIGHVDIKYEGRKLQVPTYVNSTKDIVYRGKMNMDSIIIGINMEALQDIAAVFEDRIKIVEVTNNLDRQKIVDVANIQRDERYKLGAKDLKYFRVDISDMPVMTSNNARAGRMICNEDIMELVRIMDEKKAQLKFIRGAEKELMQFVEACGIDLSEAYVKGPYKDSDRKFVAQLMLAGVNILTGEFMGVSLSSKGAGTSTNKLSMYYSIKGDGLNRLTYEAMREGANHTLVTEDLIELIDIVYSADLMSDRYIILNKVKEHINRNVREIKRILWMHKYAAYILGIKEKGSGLYGIGIQDWMHCPGGRGTWAVYDCMKRGCEGLQLKLQGIEL